MKTEEILKKVQSVNSESNYWFVRTDYGKFFNDFVNNDYIAIGWDYLTLNELENLSEERIKSRIAKVEEIDLSTFKGKIRVTTIYNKIQTFISLKKDDIVVIPSRNSEYLAFGRIVDEYPFEDIDAPEFIKRRSIYWFKTKPMDDLNPIFFQVKSNQHTISNIDKYSQHIDREIGNLFKKEDKTHFVLSIDKEEDINFDDLRTLMDNIKVLMQKINHEFNFKESEEDFFIKINLQSKGSLELIKGGNSLAILAYIIFASCNPAHTKGTGKTNPNNEDLRNEKIAKILNENDSLLDSTSKSIEALKVNTSELTKPFNSKNGN